MVKKTKVTNNTYNTSNLMNALFNQILLDPKEFDQDIVVLVKTHLGVVSPHSKAGNNLAEELITFAKNRAAEKQK
ncbi:MAG: hypothetical protein ABSA51_01645 [Anaerolineaceae bacterium]|jgi:hypothetical protein